MMRAPPGRRAPCRQSAIRSTSIALQLKTLTLFQALAQLPDHARPAEDGGVLVGDLPHPHGDHFHLGDAVVASRDATGLANQAAWVALERKGLIRSRFPAAAVVTKEGLGLRHQD